MWIVYYILNTTREIIHIYVLIWKKNVKLCCYYETQQDSKGSVDGYILSYSAV
jgi:hypothetical protein